MAVTKIRYDQINLTDLAEFIRDTIGTAMAAGAGVTVTINDPGDSITIGVAGVGSLTYQLKTSSFTAVDGFFYAVDATAGNVVVTAPASGRFGVKRIDNVLANSVTVDPPGSVTIDGDLTTTYIAQNTSTIFMHDGTNWLIESSYKEGLTGATGATGATGSTGPTGPSGSGGLLTAYLKGVIITGTGLNRLYNDSGSTVTIRSVRVNVVVAPAGSSTIFDVNLNGTTIFTTQANRPTIPAGSFTSGSAVPDTTSWPNGQYLTTDVDAVGSGYAGADATLQIGLV